MSADPSERPALRRVLELLEGGSGNARLVAGSEAVDLPDDVHALLRRLVQVLASGDALSMVPVERELTTQQAADLLNVSRQHLATLLDAGELPCRRTRGAHRRLNLEDVLVYKRKRDAQRRRSLDELVDLTEDYGGYPELKK